MLLDTCFLIDLQRERKRRRPGKACAFLESWEGAPLSFSLITYMEFLEGYPDESRETADRFLRPYKRIATDAETAWQASRIERALRAQGHPIGDHDAWIAGTARQHGLTLLTRNSEHFRRIPGLPLAVY